MSDHQQGQATNNANSFDEYPIIPNSMVEVLPRTWPGINKIGGIAKVVKCHYCAATNHERTDTSIEKHARKETSKASTVTNDNSIHNQNNLQVPSHVDVRYVVMGGRERMVPMEYCRPAPQFDASYNHANIHHVVVQSDETNTTGADRKGEQESENNGSVVSRVSPKKIRARNLRDRSALLGRCTSCGSLRSDCGSCDWVKERQGEKMGISSLSSISKQAHPRRRRQQLNNKQKYCQNVNDVKIEEDLSSTNSSSDEGTSLSSSDESYVFPNHLSRSRRQPVMSENKLYRDTFLTSSSDSSEGERDATSSSDDEDDEVLARLKAIPSSRLKDAKKRARRLARMSSKHPVRREDNEAKRLKDNRLKAVRNYENSRRNNIARIRFLNNRLQVMSRTSSVKLSTRGTESAGRDNSNGDSNISSNEKRRESRNIGTPSVLERIGNEVNLSNNLKSSSDHAQDSQPPRVDNDSGITPNPFSTLILSKVRSGSDYHVRKDDNSTELQSKHTYSKAADGGDDNEGRVSNSLNFTRMQNEDDFEDSGYSKRIGFVDGDDIGEKEIDNDGEVDDSNVNDLQMEYSYNEEKNPKRFVENEISEYHENDPYLDTFIQPEGQQFADDLPADVVDRSANICFWELPAFFDEVEKDIVNNKIPSAEAALEVIETDLKNAQSSSNVVSEERMKLLLMIESRCREQYENMSIDLVRNGSDQCRCALKRFSKKKEFRKTAREISKRQWRHQIDMMDLRFDDIDKRVDFVLRRSRNLLIESSEINGFNEESIMDYDTASDSGLDGCDEIAVITNSFHENQELSAAFEKHPYASSTITNAKKGTKRKGMVKRKRATKKQKGCGTKSKHNPPLPPNLQQKKGNLRKRTLNSIVSSGVEEDNSTFSELRRTHTGNGDAVGNRNNLSGTFGNVRRSNLPSHRKNGPTRTQQNIRKNSALTRSHQHDNRGTAIGSYRVHSGDSDSERICSDSTLGTTSIGTRLDCVVFTTQSIYEELKSSNQTADNSINITPSNVHHRGAAMTIRNACDTLHKEYPTPRSSELLRQLPLMFDRECFNENERANAAVSIFNTLLNLLKEYGKWSMTELIAMESQDIFSYLDLICCAISLIRRSAHAYLKQPNSSMNTIFSEKMFIKMVMMQLIDVLYSQLLAKQWGDPKGIPIRVYERICGLRDDLGQIAHTLEYFSKIILTFPCQQWHASTLPLNQTCNKWYVSSVAPKSLESFWRGEGIGSGQSNKSNARIIKFKKFPPRAEIDALWGIMAWFAKKCLPESNSDLRWKFTASLFTFKTGSLGQVSWGGPSQDILPPSANQLSCCAKEMLNLASLLGSGAMDPMPTDDGIIVRIIEKAIMLDSQRHFEQTTLHLESFSNGISRRDAKLVMRAWQESDLSYLVEDNNISEALSKTLLKDLLELETNSCFFSLMSSSDVLVKSLDLLDKWMARMPNKKARWSRFGDALLVFLDRALKYAVDMTTIKAPDFPSDNGGDVGDEFETHFSNSNVASMGLSLSTQSLCEAIVHIIVLVRCRRTTSKAERDDNFPLLINLRYCEMIWGAISDEDMKARRCKIADESRAHKIDTVRKGSSITVLSSMRILSILLLQLLEQYRNSSVGDNSIPEGTMQSSEECMSFILSCILSAIISASEYIDCQGVVPTTFLPLLYGVDNRDKLNTLSCGLLWLSSAVHGLIHLLHDSSLCGTYATFLQKVLDRFVPVAMDTALICLKTISSATGDKEALSSSYRSCLAFLRNTLNAYSVCHHKHNLTLPVQNKVVRNEHIKDTEDDDMFDELDDDIFLAIDLGETCGNQKSATCSRSAFDDSKERDLWSYLVMALKESKPSLRYMVHYPTTSKGRLSFTNDGRATVAAHSAGICAVIASLTIIHRPSHNDVDPLLQYFQPRRESVPALDHRSEFSNDDGYLNDVRHCLCAEICHIAKYSLTAKKMKDSTKALMLYTFVNATTNASVMNMFPTINLDVMAKVGDSTSKNKEDRLLQKVKEKYATYRQKYIGDNPDAESIGLKQVSGNYFDTPGANYLSSRLWTFCSDLGKLLQVDQRNNYLYSIGAALSTIDIDLDQYVRNITSDVLESLSQISLERECLKRVMCIRSLLSACLQDPGTLSTHHKRIASNVLSSMVSGILLDMSLLLKGAEYYKRNSSSTHPYVRAKAYALLEGYDNFMASTFSWLLSQLALTGFDSDKAELLFRNVVIPCLMSRGLNSSNAIFKAADKMNLRTNQRTLSFEFGLPVSMNLSTAYLPLLVPVLSHHIPDIIIYASTSPQSDIFYELMSCIVNLDSEPIESHLQMAPAILYGIEKKAPQKEPSLIDSIHLYLSLISMSESHNHAKVKRAVNRFRNYAIRSFLLPKLKHPKSPSGQKMKILNLLQPMLNVAAMKAKYEYVGKLSVSLGEEVKYLHLNLDIKMLATSIFECLDHAIVTQSLVKEKRYSMISQSFDCLRNVIYMSIEDSDLPLLKWCKSNANSNEDANQISIYLEALFVMSKLFSSCIQNPSILSFYRAPPHPSASIKYEPLEHASSEILDQMHKLQEKIDALDYGSSSSTVAIYTPTNHYMCHNTKEVDVLARTFFYDPSPHDINSLVAFQKEYSDAS